MTKISMKLWCISIGQLSRVSIVYTSRNRQFPKHESMLHFRRLTMTTLFLLWKYTWDLMVQTLSSLHDIKKNVFKISIQQKDFFHNHFGWKLYDMAHSTSEVKDFTQNNLFQIIYKEKFLKWNLTRLIEFILYKLHIKR